MQLVNVNREWANGKRALQRTIGEGTLPLFLGRGTVWEDRFDMAAIPYTIVLDRNHRIVYADAGMADWEGEEGRRVLEPLL